jgi:cyclase
MLRPRIIPCLLISSGGLVKTRVFKAPQYVGDPINAVKIFNEKQVDELIVLDIDASITGAEPDYGLIAKLAKECRMPLCYGGGINNVDQAFQIMESGVEKVAIGAAAVTNTQLLSEISLGAGRQSVVAVLDVRKRKKNFSDGYEICTHNATRLHKGNPIEVAANLQQAGVGEIVINSVDRDGERCGYDLELARQICDKVQVPATFLGGAGSLDHIIDLFNVCGTVGAAAGSLFVFKGKYRAVLLSYPSIVKRDDIFQIVQRS